MKKFQTEVHLSREMALTEIDVSREIVVVGFSVTIVTLGVLVIVMTTIGGKQFVAKVLETFEE